MKKAIISWNSTEFDTHCDTRTVRCNNSDGYKIELRFENRWRRIRRTRNGDLYVIVDGQKYPVTLP